MTPLLASAQRIGSWYKSSSRTKKGSELKARKKSISDKVIPKDEKKRQGFPPTGAEPVVKACLILLVEWIEPLRIGERDEG